MSATPTISATLKKTCPKCGWVGEWHEKVTPEDATAAEADFNAPDEVIAFYVTICPECDAIIPKSGFELIIGQ